jgi:enoyl-CoA hydratase/carnithine racemase
MHIVRRTLSLFGTSVQVAQSHLLDPAAKGGENMSYFMHYVTRRLRTLPLVSVAAIEGGCVGGGAELSTSCMLATHAHAIARPIRAFPTISSPFVRCKKAH